MTKYSNQDELKTNEGKSGVEKDGDQVNKKSKVEEVESGEQVEQPADEPNDDDVNTDFEKNNIAIDVNNKPNGSNVEEEDNITKDKASKSDDSKLDEKSDTSKPSDTLKEPPKRRFARDVKKSSESDSRKMARSLLQQKKKPGAVKQKGAGHLNPQKADKQAASKETSGRAEEAAAVEEIEEYYIALYTVLFCTLVEHVVLSGRGMHTFSTCSTF